LGILASVAIPKMGSAKNHADIAKGKTDVATIRSAILTERQSQLIKGNNSFIDKLSSNNEILFTGNGDGRTLLTYGITAGTTDGKWSKDTDTNNTYYFNSNSLSIEFDYNQTNGQFNCTRGDGTTDAQKTCRKLVD